jgi:hypothetical protein
MSHDHVRIAVSDSNPPGVEVVPARRVGKDEWQLIQSPLYATEVASGDVIRILNEETGAFQVMTRGGNVSVQLYLGEADADETKTVNVAKEIALEIRPLGGWMDAYTSGLIAFTVPVAVGFPSIEVFAGAADRYAGSQWQYANVYDPLVPVRSRWPPFPVSWLSRCGC